MKACLGLLLLMIDTIQAIDCECGFNEVDGVCELDEDVNASLTPGRACNNPNEARCLIFSDGVANCSCGYAWTGVNCTERSEISLGLQAGSIVYPLIVLLACFVYIGWREKKTKSSDWDVPSKHCVESPYSWCSSRVLLVYRLCVAGLGWGILMTQVTDPEGFFFPAFTIWNWMLLTFYFTLGFALSVKHQFQPSERQRLNLVERFFWILLVIETVSVLLVFVVFWGVLYASNPTFPGNTDYKSIFQHALNVLFMYIEFMLIYLPIYFHHYVYIAIWGGLYTLFHSARLVDGLSLTEGFVSPVYFFLDISTPLFYIWVTGLLIMYFVFFFMAYSTSRVKMKFQKGGFDELVTKGEK